MNTHPVCMYGQGILPDFAILTNIKYSKIMVQPPLMGEGRNHLSIERHLPKLRLRNYCVQSDKVVPIIHLKMVTCCEDCSLAERIPSDGLVRVMNGGVQGVTIYKSNVFKHSIGRINSIFVAK